MKSRIVSVIDKATPFTTQNGQLRGDLERKINEQLRILKVCEHFEENFSF
jgi:hypothetical protein